jgi:putative glutamine amidotransferase
VTRPAIIGICASLERARWGRAWEDDVALIPSSYLEHVRRAGGMPLLLPPDPVATEDPDVLLDLVDGLILAGGADVDPARYGAERHPETQPAFAERDAFELALTRRALERGLPFLGVCRGMQLLNVARGGTLRQHLPDDIGHREHRRVIGTFDQADHEVRLAPGSQAARAAGEEVHACKSHHHQGVARLGDGLEVTGWAVMDDLPEAIEDPSLPFALGVQWHPEADGLSRVIAALVDEASGFRRQPSGASSRPDA